MLRRGTKRKIPLEDSEPSDYARNLTNFQIAARNRESLRLKNQNGVQATPGLLESQLKDRLAVEMSLVEGTAKFIMACKNHSQTLEAAKTLLVARLRSDMLKFEINKLRRGRGSPQMRQGQPSYAELSLSDIRIPLLWRRKEHLNDLGDQRRFAVFCLARIGSQIYETRMLEPVDRHCTDITLQDVLLFNKVPSYFEMTVEIYAHQIENKEMSLSKLASTPQKLAKTLSRAVGKKYAKNMQDFENIGPKFELIATTTLTLDSCSEGVQTHDLYIEDPNGEMSMPLFGQICCRLAGVPYCCQEEVKSGPITVRNRHKRHMFEKNPKMAKLDKDVEFTFDTFWASIMDWHLLLWNDKSNKESGRGPNFRIPINRDTKIEDKGDLLIVTNGSKSGVEFWFEDKENLHSWLVHLIQHAADHRRWKVLAERKMEVLMQTNSRPSLFQKSLKRTRSKLVMMYDQE